ncbi:MAG: Panacea domain-containing protein [Patescibacteria group bacterium]|nr:SocA family protein [Patescibacteria group bacterium]MBU1987382.1 SocA family protein [Patescibacteria group bacterium]MBU2416281.1 SocA family protein [Patescibacteria group bacterium]MBU2456825.1 SocA family protein [Patescibacteria group bacterium]MBU2474525.1 SocA family protein [Patescibacteria group bacterium]
MSRINEKKYRNVILFFANKIKNGTLGKLKMMKLLYFLDFDFFEKYGKSVTGDKYLRWENGPVPQVGEKMINQMSGNDIKISRRKVGFGYNDQQHIEAKKNFNFINFIN